MDSQKNEKHGSEKMLFFEESPNLICSGATEFSIFLFATRTKNDNPSKRFTCFSMLVFKNHDFSKNHVFL